MDEERLIAQEMLIESVTETVLALMERESVTKAELAERLGTSRAYITQLMNGSRNMTLRTASDLAYVLGYRFEIVPRVRRKEPTNVLR